MIDLYELFHQQNPTAQKCWDQFSGLNNAK